MEYGDGDRHDCEAAQGQAKADAWLLMERTEARRTEATSVYGAGTETQLPDAIQMHVTDSSNRSVLPLHGAVTLIESRQWD